MFRFSGLLVAVALVLVAQEAQAQHIAGGGRAIDSFGEFWSVSLAADVGTDTTASGHLRLRSGGDGVYDFDIDGGVNDGTLAILVGGIDGYGYLIRITEGAIEVYDLILLSHIETFTLQKGHIGL